MARLVTSLSDFPGITSRCEVVFEVRRTGLVAIDPSGGCESGIGRMVLLWDAQVLARALCNCRVPLLGKGSLKPLGLQSLIIQLVGIIH